MTELDSYVPRAATPVAVHTNSIYRDQPITLSREGRRTVRPARLSLAGQGLPDEHVSDGMFLGLAALMLPVMVYCFTQLWSLLAGGSLNQAVRAFLP